MVDVMLDATLHHIDVRASGSLNQFSFGLCLGRADKRQRHKQKHIREWHELSRVQQTLANVTESVYNASMSLGLSRRRWVLLMSAAPVLAQIPAPTPAPQQRAEKAKNDVREVSDQLATLIVPMDVEPAFRFVA